MAGGSVSNSTSYDDEVRLTRDDLADASARVDLVAQRGLRSKLRLLQSNLEALTVLGESDVE